MIATLDHLRLLRQKFELITIDEHDRGLQFFSGGEVAYLKRLIDEQISEAEEILYELEKRSVNGEGKT